MAKREKKIITSYADAMQRLSVGRRASIGLALDSTGHHLWKDGDLAVVGTKKDHGHRAVIHPDNTVTLYFGGKDIGQLNTMFGNKPHEFVGIHETRVSTGRYKAIHNVVVAKQQLSHTYTDRSGQKVTSHYSPSVWALWRQDEGKELFWDLFDGVRFSLKTGECLNPKTVVRDRTDADTEWRRKVTRFGRALRVRAKLGAVEAYRKEDEAISAKRAAMDYAYPGRWQIRQRWTREKVAHVIDTCDLSELWPDLVALAHREYEYRIKGNTWRWSDLTPAKAIEMAWNLVYGAHRDAIRMERGAVNIRVEAA